MLFYISSSESYFVKYKKLFKVSVSGNIRKFHFLKYNEFFEVFVSQNIRKAFFWENIRFFLILALESSISQNIKKYKNFFREDFWSSGKAFFGENIRNLLRVVFFIFWAWAWKCSIVLGSSIKYYSWNLILFVCNALHQKFPELIIAMITSHHQGCNW